VGGLKICVIGGGSTYTPELIEGFIERGDELPVAAIALMDIDENRLRVVGGLAERMLRAAEADIELRLTTQRQEALEGTDYVITQIRVGGLACRIQDEKIPLQFGVVGQETTGPGGFAKALRTIPVLLDIAHDVAEVAPAAHLINFTNPSGIITEALLKYTDIPTVGLCNSPFGFQQGIAQQLGVAPERIQLDYVGLNHLSWIRGVTLDGKDVFDQVLEGAIALARAGEFPFSPQLLETLGMIPSYYLNYYYNHDQVVAEQRRAEKTRGEVVQEIEASLLELYADPNLKHKPKLLEKRGGAHYSTVAVAVINAIHHDNGEVHIVNTRNNGALPDLPLDCVVELPSVINGSGARAVPVVPMPLAIRGLTQAVKAYEELTVLAGVEGNEQAALQALLAHPLVPSFAVAQGLWAAIKEANRTYLPQFEGPLRSPKVS
jgi:6-phospho-beta-glucosidase